MTARTACASSRWAASPELWREVRSNHVDPRAVEGHSNTSIADHYVLSLETVLNHVSNVMTEPGLESRAEVVARARDAGLGRPTT